MDKYHHTAISICKRKEHKAAPRKSRHAKKMIIYLKRSTKDKMSMIAGVYVCVVWQLMESQFMTKHGQMVGLKRGDNLMLCKVNWSAECLLTNYFNEVVSINCYNILCYQFVVLFLISSKE